MGGLDHRMDGRASESTLLGLEGNDRLFGGTGNDSIEGGDGCDTTSGNGRDVIDLASIDADTTLGGEQNLSFRGVQTTAADLGFGANVFWVEKIGEQTRLVGNTDADADIGFAVRIDDGAGITASDDLPSDFIL